MTSTTKRITNGSAGGSPPIHVIVAAYLLTSAAATPTIRPPTNVSGRLVNDPMAAAPNAAKTTVVSVAPSSSCPGRQHEAGHAREHAADDPGPAADPDRVVTAERDQLRVVDHAAHDDAEARRTEEPVEDARHHRREHEQDDLLVGDVHVEDAHRRQREEVRERRRVHRVPQQPDARHDEDQPDGGDDLDRLARVLERSGEQLQHEPDERSEHEHARSRRRSATARRGRRGAGRSRTRSAPRPRRTRS